MSEQHDDSSTGPRPVEHPVTDPVPTAAESRSMSPGAVQPAAPGASVAEPVVTVSSVSVRRAPRYYRFMAVGLAVGVIVTLVLTFAFPEQDEFTRLQVLGFTGIFVVAICVALGALVAIVLDRASRGRARTVTAERTEGHDAPEA